MISYVIPTRNRQERLAQTLEAIAALGEHDAEIIIVDNASDEPTRVPNELASGVPVELIESPENLGAAARNLGVEHASTSSEWVVMLDDDSHPIDLGFLKALKKTDPDVAAVMADIWLPNEERREDGGLPEVFVGCGVALRRQAFLDCGGYDPTFEYYAEEYDLTAKLMLAGWRVEFEPTFRVDHHKIQANRNFGKIVERLVRNNGWVMQRYVPDLYLDQDLADMKNRYRSIAEQNRVVGPYDRGRAELEATIEDQKRTPMSEELYDRFVGLAAARASLGYIHESLNFRTAHLWKPGKNAWVVRRVLAELGVREVKQGGQLTVIGTMSPGPMLDAAERLGTNGFAPWKKAHIPDNLRRKTA